MSVLLLPANIHQRADVLEVSLSIIPSNHVILIRQNMEAEASGLLDRMLAVFHEDSRYVYGNHSPILELTHTAMLYPLMPL